MFHASFDDDPMAMMAAAGRPPRRFDEYYRCYPVNMLAGPDRDTLTHGGKAVLPPSALDKLSRLHISYPMLFELHNGEAGLTTHCGVLEFIAEEGRIYLPPWILDTLDLQPGDLIQIKSTDLPLGNFIKVEPQSPAFLDISDPKAVLENAFRNFSCLTLGDIFTFAYNDNIYSIKVLETKPSIAAGGAICVIETDIEVDFAPPVGYVEPTKQTMGGAAGAVGGKGKGGVVHTQGSMAQAINYASIAPSSGIPAAGAKATSSNFLQGGHKLKPSKGSKAPTPKPSTPVAGASSNQDDKEKEKEVMRLRRSQGPQALRLPHGKLFFGYEVKPLRAKEENGGAEDSTKQHFEGKPNVLRKGGKVPKVAEEKMEDVKPEGLKGTGEKGRSLKDFKKG